jgi:hypothetical protein
MAETKDKKSDSNEKALEELEVHGLPKVGEEEVPSPVAEDRELDHESQGRLLNEYRVTGVNRGYIDQSRDQEPDIGEAFGQAPHPELFNPEPAANAAVSGVGRGGQPGIGEVNHDPRVRAARLADPEADKANEDALAREEALLAGAGAPTVAPGPAQPVVVVADRSSESKDSKSKS